MSTRRHTRCPRDWTSDVCSSNLKYMDTYEGYELSDSPRLGQQTYTLKFEPVDGSPAFYMYPIVYPMLTTLGPDNIEWSVEPHVRSGLLSDIYLYVRSEERRVGTEWRWRRA